MRQAARLCSRRVSAAAFGKAALNSGARRTYVSETKKDSATVNVESTIKADHKAFLQQTGTRSENATMPSTGMGADAMMSPAAGRSLYTIVYQSILISE